VKESAFLPVVLTVSQDAFFRQCMLCELLSNFYIRGGCGVGRLYVCTYLHIIFIIHTVITCGTLTGKCGFPDVAKLSSVEALCPGEILNDERLKDIFFECCWGI
jgi:hypothetical protein